MVYLTFDLNHFGVLLSFVAELCDAVSDILDDSPYSEVEILFESNTDTFFFNPLKKTMKF